MFAGTEVEEDALQVEWWSIIPFLLMLGTIAVAPLVPALAHYWEWRRVQLLVALVLGVPVAIWFLVGGDNQTVVHALVEYGQFITLLFALFVVSGGIFLAGDLRATPKVNTTFLAVGAGLASFIGTTGAAMLLIRPLLNTNQERRHRMHSVVFLIFIVANCGGLLTPLGGSPSAVDECEDLDRREHLGGDLDRCHDLARGGVVLVGHAVERGIVDGHARASCDRGAVGGFAPDDHRDIE